MVKDKYSAFSWSRSIEVYQLKSKDESPCGLPWKYIYIILKEVSSAKAGTLTEFEFKTIQKSLAHIAKNKELLLTGILEKSYDGEVVHDWDQRTTESIIPKMTPFPPESPIFLPIQWRRSHTRSKCPSFFICTIKTWQQIKLYRKAYDKSIHFPTLVCLLVPFLVL